MSGPMDFVRLPDGSTRWTKDIELAAAVADTKQYTRDYCQQVIVDNGGAPVFVFQQETPASVWVILHSLNGYPTVVIVDSSGQPFLGDVHYDSNVQMTITFSAPFSGVAYLR